MKPQHGSNPLKRMTHVTTDALTGRRGISMMILAFSLFAIVLLAYVSTHVYTSSLMEDLSDKKRIRSDLKERIGILTAEYTSLASRGRISRICEEKLGLIEGSTELVERILIGPGTFDAEPHLEFTEKPVDLPKVLGKELDGITEVMRR